MSLFAVIYRPGKTWTAGLPFQEQPGVFDHRDFLAGQRDAGTLVFGGPFLDDSGGLSVFDVESEVALRALLERDETVQRGLLMYEHHPYALPFPPK